MLTKFANLRHAYDLAFFGDASCRVSLLRASDERSVNLLKEIRAMWRNGLRLVEAGQLVHPVNAVPLAPVGTLRHTGSSPRNYCDICESGDIQVCCTHASYSDGTADNPVCTECCPVHGTGHRDTSDEVDYDDGYWDCRTFADPGGRSALSAASASNPRDRPCPTCHRSNCLTPEDETRGYQCDSCADSAEMGW